MVEIINIIFYLIGFIILFLLYAKIIGFVINEKFQKFFLENQSVYPVTVMTVVIFTVLVYDLGLFYFNLPNPVQAVVYHIYSVPFIICGAICIWIVIKYISEKPEPNTPLYAVLTS